MISFIGHLSSNIKDDDKRLQGRFCWHIGGFETTEAVKRRVQELKVVNPDLLIGCHRSASTFMPRGLDTPGHPKHVDSGELDDSWLLHDAEGKVVTWPDNPDRPYADMSKGKVRTRIVLEAISMAKSLGMGAKSFDNCYYWYPLGALSKAQVTTAFVKFFTYAKTQCALSNLKIIANVAMDITSHIPDAFACYGSWLDGVMLELPLYVKKPDYLEKEIAAYRKFLESGKQLFLWAKDTEELAFFVGRLHALLEEFPGQVLFAKKTGWDNDNWFYYG